MRCAVTSLVSFVLLGGTLGATPLPPTGPRPAATHGPAAPSALASLAATGDPERACRRNAAANWAVQKRFARKVKQKPEYLLGVYASPIEGPIEGGTGLFKNPLREEISRCFKTAGGAVSLSIRAITGCADDECSDMRVHTNLVFIKDAQQIQIKMPPIRLDGDLLHDLYSLGGAFDYDGDGSPEVLIAHHFWEEGESSDESIELKSIKHGELVPYPQAPPLKLFHPSYLAKDSPERPAHDVDGDGRPDLYSTGPYASLEKPDPGQSGDGLPEIPALFIYHSLPDGSFSANDAVARAALAKDCPVNRSPSAVELIAQAKAQRKRFNQLLIPLVLCERARGKSAAEVLKAHQLECRKWPAEGDWNWVGEFLLDSGEAVRDACPIWLKKMLAIPPPTVLSDEAKPAP